MTKLIRKHYELWNSHLPVSFWGFSINKRNGRNGEEKKNDSRRLGSKVSKDLPIIRTYVTIRIKYFVHYRFFLILQFLLRTSLALSRCHLRHRGELVGSTLNPHRFCLDPDGLTLEMDVCALRVENFFVFLTRRTKTVHWNRGFPP
jgi:hypothetical protein